MAIKKVAKKTASAVSKAYSNVTNATKATSSAINSAYKTAKTPSAPSTPIAPRTTAQQAYAAYNSEDNAYNKILQQQVDAQLKAQQLATDQGVSNLQNQKTTTGQNYDEQARQAEIAYRQRQVNLPDQLAQQGITGGGSESANLQSQLNLENSRQSIGTERQNAYNTIDQSIADLRATGNVSAANIQADAVSKRLDEFTRQQAYVREDAANALARKDAATAQTRADALATRTGAYADIQAKINSLKNDGDTSNDYLIPYYESDRATKIQEQQAAAAAAEKEAAETAYKQWLDQEKLNIAQQKNAIAAAKKASSGSSKSSSSGSGITNKTDAYNAEYADVVGGNVSKEDVKANRDALIRTYGEANYSKLYAAAKKYYKATSTNSSGVQYLTAF